MKKFSDRVSSLRTRLGVSQETFAKQLGVSRNYVSMIEQGRQPSESLKKLIETMEATPSSKPQPVTREEPMAYHFTRRSEPSPPAPERGAETLAACHTLLDSFSHVTSAETFEFALRSLMEKLEAYRKIKLS